MPHHDLVLHGDLEMRIYIPYFKSDGKTKIFQNIYLQCIEGPSKGCTLDKR